jgi:hypothetical protein
LFAKMAAKSPAFTTYQQKASPRVIPVVALTRVPCGRNLPDRKWSWGELNPRPLECDSDREGCRPATHAYYCPGSRENRGCGFTVLGRA